MRRSGRRRRRWRSRVLKVVSVLKFGIDGLGGHVWLTYVAERNVRVLARGLDFDEAEEAEGDGDYTEHEGEVNANPERCL